MSEKRAKTMADDLKLRRSLHELSARITGAANAIVERPDFDFEALREMLADDPHLLEMMRVRMLARMVDHSLNYIEPGNDLRPMVERMAKLLGVEAEEWDAEEG